MIKINLLDSVTERQGGAVVAVERKIASPVSTLVLMAIAVSFLLLAVIGWDIISTQMAKADAERQLAEQKQIAAELEAVTERAERAWKRKIQNIDSRIEAIKKLRAFTSRTERGFGSDARKNCDGSRAFIWKASSKPAIRLTIKGNSPDEAAVTQFGRSLEFSGGFFSNLNIETQRKDAPNQPTSAAANPDAPKDTIVGFTIRCAYTPSKAGASKNMMPTTASNAAAPAANQTQAPAPPNAATPPQVAKN